MATVKANQSAEAVVQVVGQGTLSGRNGLPFLLVSSESEPGRVHVCAYAYEGAFVGSRMHCDCVAASFGKSCKHVLVARAWLAGFSSVSSQRTQQQVADETTATLRKVSRDLDELDARDTLDASRKTGSHPGDTAPVRRSNRAFSLMK